MRDILWVGFDETNLDTIELAMQWIVNDTEDDEERRQALSVIVTIDAARNGDWTPTAEHTKWIEGRAVDCRPGMGES